MYIFAHTRGTRPFLHVIEGQRHTLEECGIVNVTGRITVIGHVLLLPIEEHFVEILSPERTGDRDAGLSKIEVRLRTRLFL